MIPIENVEEVEDFVHSLRAECMLYEFNNKGKDFEICISMNLYNILTSSVSLVGVDLRNGERYLWGHPIHAVPNTPPYWFLLGESKTLHHPARYR